VWVLLLRNVGLWYLSSIPLWVLRYHQRIQFPRTRHLKLYADKLSAHLQQKTAPVYFLHGDEPLQIMELGDQLRTHAKTAGYAERQVFYASEDTDWAAFREAADSLSLFAEQRLIEVRLPTGKPGRAGGEQLKAYCQNPPPDVLLLITSSKLERGGKSSAWFKAIDKVGVTIEAFPVVARDLPRWIDARCRAQGLQADKAALAIIAERVEGNLLAAAQEVERLALLYPSKKLMPEDVLAAVSDSARYSINDLAAAALAGDAARAVRIVRGLREEAVAPVLVLWALSAEIRSATRAAEAIAEGVPQDKALKAAGVWASRVGPLKVALKRHSVASWLHMLQQTSEIDRQIKGQEPGDVWDSFTTLSACLAGHGETFLTQRLA